MRPLLFLAALTLSSCSLFGGGEAEIDARFFLPAAAAGGAPFSISIDTGRGVRTLDRADFAAVGDRQFDAAPLVVGAQPAQIVCAVGPSGAAGDVSVEIDLQADWRYRVSCHVAASNPIQGCFGCRGSAAAPLDPTLGFAADDSLFVVWGGDPVDSPVLY